MKSDMCKLRVNTLIVLTSGEQVKTSFSKESIEKNLRRGKRLLFVNHRYFISEEIFDLIHVVDDDYIEVQYGEAMFASDKIREPTMILVA